MSEATVKLGLMPPLSGLVGIYGTEIARAGQIACQEINARGGVLGRPLELVIEDDGSLPETAVAAAERLAGGHRCVALIGNLLSNSRIAVAYRVAEPRKIPYLNFSFYEGSIRSRYFFHFAALPNQQIDRMIPCMRERYGRRMFFAGNNYEWPRGSIDAAKQALARAGGEVVGEEYCPIGVGPADIERLLDQVAAAAPDVFVPYFAGEDQLRLLTRFSERGMKSRMAVVMGHFDEVMASQLPPAVRDGFYSSNTYFMTVDTPGNRDALARLSAWPGVAGLWPRGNGLLTNFGEGTYLCVQAFAQAANRAGRLDAETLVDALESVALCGPQGAVRMDPVMHHAQVNTYLARCRADGSFALIEAFGAIDPVLPERYSHLQLNPAATPEEDIRLQARMLEQMTEAVLLLRTDDASIVYTNAGAERMFGYAPHELIGQRVSVLNAPAQPDPEQAAAAILDVLSRKGRWDGEIRNARKDGTTFWTSASVSAFTHPVHGEVWMSVQKDITELKALQEELDGHRHHLETVVAERTAELVTAREHAEAATQAKTVFLANMSHEIRTPLNVIIGLCHLLRRDLTDPLQRQRLDQLGASSDHLLDIINDVLDLSKIEAQRLALDSTDFRLDSVLGKVVRMVEGPAQSKGLTLTTDVTAPLQALPLHGDPLRLAQILINLCGNAVKFTDQGMVRLGIECLAEDAAQATLRFTVEDTGIGIAPAEQLRLFQPFTQADSSFSRARGGTGLGLAISQHLVAMMGGTIHVDSVPGTGSCFSFELAVPRARAAVPEGVAEVRTSDFGGRRVLFAEDHPLSQEILFEMLEDLGCEVDVASDGAEVVDCARARSYDLILMDMQMPRMDGLAATRAIRALPLHRDTHIIALTANAFAEDRQRCLEAGMDGHIGKPVTPATLAAALGQWLKDLVVPVTETQPADQELSLALAAIPGLDPACALRRSAGQMGDYVVLLNRFGQLHGLDMAQLRTHLAAGDRAAALLVAHNLKGIAGLIGAWQVASLASELTHALRSGADEAGIGYLASACESELRSLAEAFRTLPGLPAVASAGA